MNAARRMRMSALSRSHSLNEAAYITRWALNCNLIGVYDALEMVVHVKVKRHRLQGGSAVAAARRCALTFSLSDS